MMIIATRQLGDIEIEETSIYTFEQGLPGFESLTRFVFIDLGSEWPVRLMQAVEEPGVSFFVCDPFRYYPDYEWDMPEELKAELDIKRVEDVEVLSVITLSEELPKSTVNLLAPLVLNRAQRLGKQHIIHGSGYTHSHPVFQTV